MQFENRQDVEVPVWKSEIKTFMILDIFVTLDHQMTKFNL